MAKNSNEIIQKVDRIHSYPAKFTINLAMEYIQKYSNEGDVVYDPFAGSGTTLLGSSLLKRVSFGTDINYIAVLISEFKLNDLSNEQVLTLKKFISQFERNWQTECESVERFNYPSIEHWFCEDSIIILSYIKSLIEKIDDEKCKTFCKLVFSAIVNNASNQESDTRYAAIYKPSVNKEYVAKIFIKKFNSTLELMENLERDPKVLKSSRIYLHDSKKCSEVIKENSVDLILTSPPYPNTYDYYLYHKHRMNWLGYDVKFSMEKEIGSRREFSSLKHPKEKFDDDMFEIFAECNRLLKKGGVVVLVMGDGKISGVTYEAKSNMERICKPLGWEPIDYSFTMLDDTSRSFTKSYRTTGKKEHIIVFKKQ